MTARPRSENLQALNVRLDALQSDVSDIKSAMASIANMLAKLASLEQQHLDTKAALTRAFGEIGATNNEIKVMQERMAQRLVAKDEQIRAIELDMPQVREMLKYLPDMPGWREMRRYIVTGVIVMVGSVFLALIAIVVKTPSVFAPGTVVMPEQPPLKRPSYE